MKKPYDYPLPDGWEYKLLGVVSRIIMGQSPDSSSYNEDGNGYPFLQGCAEFGNKYPTPTINCSTPTKISPEDSILISVRAPVGDLNLSNTTYCIGRGLASIVSESIDKVYLFNFIKLNRDKLDKVSQGSTFLAIGSKELINFGLLAPPLPEQKAIAEVLTTIDNVIEKTEALIEKLKYMKAGLMQDLFTRGVFPDGSLRPPREEAPELYQQSELGWIPKEWEVVRLGDVGLITTGNTPPTNNDKYYNGQIPFISPADMGRSIYINDTEKHLSEEGVKVSREIPPDTILTVCIGSTIGKMAITSERSCTNQQINALTCSSNTKCVFYSMSNYLYVQLMIAAGLQAVPIVNKSRFANLKIAMPIDEHEKNAIENQMDSIDKSIDRELSHTSALYDIKQGLMDDLLTGKVRVMELLKDDVNV